MDKSTKKGLTIFIIIIAATIVLSAVRSFAGPKIKFSVGNSPDIKISSIKDNSKPYFAIINIEGTITSESKNYNQKWLLSTINTLKKDSKNMGILLFINSPGGTVYHADEAYLALLDYKETGKKVYAYFGSLAASGGYYIACSADKIYANRNTLTGSIGVITASSIDATEMLKKIGIKSTTITAGRNKNMLNYDSPVTDEQRQIMQSIADECYDQFTQIVADSRKMNLDEVKKLADGRIYTAKQAKENNLIDEIYGWKEAQDLISRENDNIRFKKFEYEEENSLRALLKGAAGFIKNPQAAVSSPVPAYLYTAN